MKHDTIMDIARDAAGGMLSYDAEGICSLSGPEILRFAEMLVNTCGYYADVFDSLGCPMDMDPTETKPSDYIKKMLEK